MDTVDLAPRTITEFGSVGVSMLPLARLRGEPTVAVDVATYAAGAALGRHAGGLWQLFAVTAGVGWVAGADGSPRPIRAGQAVLWAPGEPHASGSATGMKVTITQSSLRPSSGTAA